MTPGRVQDQSPATGWLLDPGCGPVGNSFGKSPGELERVLDDLRAVEPLLRHTADHEIRTVKPLRHVVTEVLRLASASSQAAGTVTFGDDGPWQA